MNLTVFKRLCLGISAWFCVATLCAQEAPRPQWCYETLDTTVSIVPDRGMLSIRGTGTLVLHHETSSVDLRVNGSWQTLRFESLSSRAGDSKINVLNPEHKAWRIGTLQFSKPRAPGSRIQVEFELVKERDAFPLAVKANAAVAISDAVWLPVSGDMGCDLPPGKLTFLMPVGWHAASNGKVVASGMREGRAFETYQIPKSHQRAFIAAPYHLANGRAPTSSIDLYLLNATLNSSRLLESFAAARQFLEERYGPVPFADYKIAEMPNDLVPWYGASEEGLIITRNEMMGSEEAVLNNFVHELAHAWWGNKVTPTGPGSYLLNEGMASFSGIEFFESRVGREGALAYLEFGSPSSSPDATTYGYLQLACSGKDVPLAALKPDSGDDYNIAQSKGVWVLRMLADRVGRERFFHVLRMLESEPNLTQERFRKAFEAEAPEMGLSQFFRQWLDRPGIPVIGLEWRNQNATGKPRALITIFQKQRGEPYDLDLEVLLRTRKGVVTRSVHIDRAQVTVEIDLPGELVDAVVDPGSRLLVWRPSYRTLCTPR